MGPRAPSLVWDWTRVVEVFGGVVLLTVAVVAAVTAAGIVAVWTVRGDGAPAAGRRRARWWLRHRAARSFATAVAVGDIALAEIEARRLLRGNDPFHQPRPHGWDERIILECPWAEAVAQVGHLDTAAVFPTTRSVHDDGTTDVVIGRHHRIHLRVLSEELMPGEGVRFAVDAGGPVISGHLTVLPIPPAVPSASGDAAVVWVHVEAPRGWRAHRALRAVRTTTKAGLRRWATTREPA